MHVGDPTSIGADGGRGGFAERRGDGSGRAAIEGLAVDALTVVSDEPGVAVRQGEVAATVADARADEDVAADIADGGGATIGGGDGGDAAVAASLEPPERAAIGVPGGPAQADTAREGGGRDGALPESVGAALGHVAAFCRMERVAVAPMAGRR